MKEISILITVYNCEKYLKGCLDSIDDQNFKKEALEVIVVEDCSKDKSIEICKKYEKKHPDWNFIYNKKNKGCAGSRAVALKNATGKYIMFLDSDDILYKKCIVTLYNCAIKSHADIVVARLNAFDDYKTYGYYSDKYINKNQLTNVYKNHKLLNCISVCSKLFKKEKIMNLYFLKNVTHEDNYFTMSSFLNCKKIYTLNKPLYYRRIRNVTKDSIMQNLNYKTYKDLLTNYKSVVDDFKTHKNINFVYSFMIKKACNYIINNIKKEDLISAKKNLSDFIEYLYYNNCIRTIRKNYYMLYFLLYYNFFKWFKKG